MNKKIKVYSFVLTLIYVSLIAGSLASEFNSFVAGFKDGMRDSRLERKKGEKEHRRPSLVFMRTLYAELEAVEDAASSPDVLLNKRTGKWLPVSIREAKFSFNEMERDTYPAWYYAVDISMIILAFPLLFCVFLIPVFFYRFIRSVSRGNLLSLVTIRALRWIAWLLVFVCLCSLYMEFIVYTVIKDQIDLENYKIVFSFNYNGLLLLLGVVTLLLAEILKVSLKMKEEQELTV